MEAAPELVAAHLAAHAEHPGGVVLGYFPMADHARATSLLHRSSACWWEKQFARQSRPEHRFTFRDICTGNMSLPRQLFEAVGGFDTRFQGRAGEDHDLGIRLIKRRVPVRLMPAAMSIHHHHASQSRSFQRAAAEGRGHVLLARKHPEITPDLPLGQPGTTPLFKHLWRLLWRQPTPAALLAALCYIPLSIGAMCNIRWLWEPSYGCLHSYWYWCGVRAELGSLPNLRWLIRATPPIYPATWGSEVSG
jgi:GT2 family glycosyltransferase